MRISTLLTIVAEQLEDIALTSNNSAQKQEAKRLLDIINSSIPRVVDEELTNSSRLYNEIIKGFQDAGKMATEADAMLKKVAGRIGTEAEVLDTAVKIAAALALIL